LNEVASGWEGGDPERALGAFTHDAVYIEPPDIQLFRGRDELRRYFAAVPLRTLMRWQGLWFDEASQTGAGEFSFWQEGRVRATHGVAVITLHQGRIALWREYQREGPATFKEFCQAGGKAFRWHGGNYP
jgi:hypothetical protein